MIDYTLAKELKEAGFPSDWEGFCGHCGYSGGANSPTLSELIEACGEEGFRLTQMARGWLAEKGEVYFSGNMVHRFEHAEYKHGDTPEEAVARLWLALNKK